MDVGSRVHIVEHVGWDMPQQFPHQCHCHLFRRQLLHHRMQAFHRGLWLLQNLNVLQRAAKKARRNSGVKSRNSGVIFRTHSFGGFES